MELKNKKILITGGAGFIGSELAKKLCKDNKMRLFDNFARGTADVISKMPNKQNVELVKGDVTNYDDVEKAVSGCDVVYHLASVAGIHTVTKRPTLTIEVTLIGTQNILKACLKHKVSRLLYTSTSEVYGPMAFNMTEEDFTSQGPLSEPRWYYATAKLAAENLIHAYYREYGLKITTVRLFNIYGPTQIGEGAIGSFVNQAVTNQPITVYGQGNQIRAWCYVDDCVRALILAADDKAIGQCLNIGNPYETPSVYQLAKQVIKLTGSNSQIVFQDRFSDKGDVFLRVPDIRKIKNLLGYEPQVFLEEGLKITIEGFRKRFPQ
jgi:nucleoside-diphosphate-sugar epimerase